MRRPRADREEKRVTYGNGLRREEQLDPGNPNQRRLLERCYELARSRPEKKEVGSVLF